MSKKKKNSVDIGYGLECPRCNKPMIRREKPVGFKTNKRYYFSEWDYCKDCGHLQLYEHYKVFNNKFASQNNY